MDIDAELSALEKAYAQARGGKRGELLFAALLMCWERPLPEWVFSALAKLLVARQPKISAVKERWVLARALLGPKDPTFEQWWERRKLIRRGLAALVRAEAQGPLGPYALQAAIAACHARARAADDTDWPRIVSFYQKLAEITPSRSSNSISRSR
jgi:predicted RNA polymerase sigma factor